MKAVLTVLAMACAAITVPLHAQTQAASAPEDAALPPSPAAVAASRSYGATNPAIKAVENSRPAGETRPPLKVVPQVNMPFKRAGQDATGAIEPGSIDDSAARCLATTGAEARKACEQAARDQAADAKRGTTH
jgi:hypothetical protein